MGQLSIVCVDSLTLNLVPDVVLQADLESLGELSRHLFIDQVIGLDTLDLSPREEVLVSLASQHGLPLFGVLEFPAHASGVGHFLDAGIDVVFTDDHSDVHQVAADALVDDAFRLGAGTGQTAEEGALLS